MEFDVPCDPRQVFDLPLIDGDLVLYKAGFSANRTEYRVNHPLLPTVTYSSKYDAQYACHELSIDESLIEGISIEEPVDHAIHNLKKLIAGISASTGGNEPIVMLSGPSEENFRYTVDAEYKGNRSGRKPAHFEELREYLLTKYKTVVSRGCEADDLMYPAAVAAATRGHSAVICSIDKDMLTLPGWHYNWDKNEVIKVTPVQAYTNFARQMVVGDTSDNVKGIPGVGPKGAMKKVNNIMNAKGLYYSYYGSPTITREEWNKNAKLLWIWRKLPDECPHLIT